MCKFQAQLAILYFSRLADEDVQYCARCGSLLYVLNCNHYNLPGYVCVLLVPWYRHVGYNVAAHLAAFLIVLMVVCPRYPNSARIGDFGGFHYIGCVDQPRKLRLRCAHGERVQGP